MGKYINSIGDDTSGASYQDKCALLERNGAQKVEPKSFQKDLVCVVNNGPFAAAGYAYSEREFDYFYTGFEKGSDPRPHQWYILPNAADYAE